MGGRKESDTTKRLHFHFHFIYRSVYTLGFTCGSAGKGSGNAGDLGLIPGLGRSPGEGHGSHSSIVARKIPCTEEPGRLQSMGWVAKSQTRLSDFTFTFILYNCKGLDLGHT